jgi:hypothetical protein
MESQTTILNQLINDDITNFLVKAHLDLFHAEEKEDYESYAVIRNAIHLSLNHGAEILAMTTGYQVNNILRLLHQVGPTHWLLPFLFYNSLYLSDHCIG